MTLSTPDYDHLMKANLERVFSERDAARRMEAIRELYAEGAALYEPHAAVRGHEAISHAVGDLLASLPPDFIFSASTPAVGHHGAGRIKWQGGPRGGAVAVTGIDVAFIEDGHISALHVFLDPAGS